MANGGVLTKVGKNLSLRRVLGVAGYSAISVFKVGTGTTTPAATDTDVETVVAGWNGGGDTKTFLNNQVDSTNVKTIVQGYVSSTQANGNTISEVGVFNTDGTAQMWSHDVFTGIAKTSLIEIIFEWQDEAT